MSEQAPIEEKRRWAADTRAWFDAYVEVGFTVEQALRLVVATMNRSVVNVQGVTPEMSEFMSKASILMDRDIADD